MAEQHVHVTIAAEHVTVHLGGSRAGFTSKHGAFPVPAEHAAALAHVLTPVTDTAPATPAA